MDDMMIAASPENTMAVYGFSNMDEEEEVTVSPTDSPAVVVPPVPVADDGPTKQTKCNKKKRMIFYGPRPRYDSDLMMANLLLIVLLYASLRFIRSQ